MNSFKEKLIVIWRLMKRLYTVYGSYMTMAAKAVVAFCAFSYINQFFPGRGFLLRTIVVVAISLLAAVLPWKFLGFLAAVWLLGQLSALSLEATAFCFVVLLILVLLRYLTLPGAGLTLVVLPLLFLWKIPFLAPLVVGVAGGLSGFISVGSGVIIFYMLQLIARNLDYLSGAEAATLVQRLLFLVKGLALHEQLLTVVVCFCLTTLLVYLISRLKFSYAPQIAVAVGALMNPLLLLISFDFQGLAPAPESLIWGSLAALPLALGISLLYRFLDYAKTENVQFEDDEYYYFVKAVPKVALTGTPQEEKAVAAIPLSGGADNQKNKEETEHA